MKIESVSGVDDLNQQPRTYTREAVRNLKELVGGAQSLEGLGFGAGLDARRNVQ